MIRHNKGLTVELWEGYVKNNHKKCGFSTYLSDSITMGLKHDFTAVLD